MPAPTALIPGPWFLFVVESTWRAGDNGGPVTNPCESQQFPWYPVTVDNCAAAMTFLPGLTFDLATARQVNGEPTFLTPPNADYGPDTLLTFDPAPDFITVQIHSVMTGTAYYSGCRVLPPGGCDPPGGILEDFAQTVNALTLSVPAFFESRLATEEYGNAYPPAGHTMTVDVIRDQSGGPAYPDDPGTGVDIERVWEYGELTHVSVDVESTHHSVRTNPYVHVIVGSYYAPDSAPDGRLMCLL